jgi:hypothetical protein
VEDNRIVDINNLTGHYKSTVEDLHEAVKYIKSQQGEFADGMTVTGKVFVEIGGHAQEFGLRWNANEFHEKGRDAKPIQYSTGNDYRPIDADLPAEVKRDYGLWVEPAAAPRPQAAAAGAALGGHRRPAPAAAAAAAAAPPAPDAPE